MALPCAGNSKRQLAYRRLIFAGASIKKGPPLNWVGLFLFQRMTKMADEMNLSPPSDAQLQARRDLLAADQARCSPKQAVADWLALFAMDVAEPDQYRAATGDARGPVYPDRSAFHFAPRCGSAPHAQRAGRPRLRH